MELHVKENPGQGAKPWKNFFLTTPSELLEICWKHHSYISMSLEKELSLVAMFAGFGSFCHEGCIKLEMANLL